MSEGRVLTVVYAVLMMLLALTLGAAYLHLGRASMLVAFTIACAKAALIALFFMEVRRSIPAIKLVIAICIIWTAIFGALSFTDYIGRSWPINPYVASGPYAPQRTQEAIP